jgi:hypothetical protein
MKGQLIRKRRSQIYAWLFIWLMASLGCGAKQEAPLSEGAAAFKKEVQQALAMLAGDLTGPVAKSDVAAIQAALKSKMPESLKLCRACPFMIGVLDRHGDVLAIYPAKNNYSRYYSHYNMIVQALKHGKARQGWLFLADGSKLFTICTPLRQAGQPVGLIVMTTTEDEVKKRWGISEKEFLAIDFNV